MRLKLKAKLRGSRGFSLAETFLAVLILVMVSSIVASGVPVAASAYHKIVDASNAQLLLSTTMTVLRDELGTAQYVENTDGRKQLVYTNKHGTRIRLSVAASADATAPVEGETATAAPVDDSSKGLVRSTGGDAVPLVSKAAANENLHTSYDTVSYDNGIVTFTNLAVKRDGSGETLAFVESYQIRVLTAE